MPALRDPMPATRPRPIVIDTDPGQDDAIASGGYRHFS